MIIMPCNCETETSTWPILAQMPHHRQFIVTSQGPPQASPLAPLVLPLPEVPALARPSSSHIAQKCKLVSVWIAPKKRFTWEIDIEGQNICK